MEHPKSLSASRELRARAIGEIRSRLGKCLRRILDCFTEPDEEAVKEMLFGMGVNESDENFEKLKTRLLILIGRKTNKKDFSGFFRELAIQLYKKIKKRERRLSERVRNESVHELKEQIARSREQIVSELIMRAFSPQVLTIIDRPTYRILETLYKGEEKYESLKRILDLRNKDMVWRINYLNILGFVETHYGNNGEFYALSKVGKSIFEKKGAEFGKLIDLLLNDRVHQLCLRAVGGDRMNAKKLENWLKNNKGKGHMTIIEKLGKVYEKDPKKISQAFFGAREMGATHERHIGIKIDDHQASGRFLLACSHMEVDS